DRRRARPEDHHRPGAGPLHGRRQAPGEGGEGMKERLTTLYNKDGTRTVLASVISILIGLAVGSIIVLIVGLTSSNLSGRSAWEGIRLVLFGILSTGRDA